MSRVFVCCIAALLSAAHPAMAGERIYTCERDDGEVTVSNTPFDDGECRNVTEVSVDSEVNLVTSEEPGTGSPGSGLQTSGGPNQAPPIPLFIGPDLEVATKAIEASGAANLSASSAESAARSAARLAANPYDPALENAAEAAARSAGATVDPTVKAAFDAAGSAKTANVPQLATNATRAARGAYTAGRATQDTAAATDSAVQLSRAGADPESIRAAAETASQTADIAAQGAEVSNNASQGLLPSGDGVAQGAPTAISGDTAGGSDAATGAVLAAPATFGASGTLATPAQLPPPAITGP